MQSFGQQDENSGHHLNGRYVGLSSTTTTLKQDPRRANMMAGTGLPSHILNVSPPVETMAVKMRVSNGGTSKLETIKAFVEKANRT
jgi:hypothetical protein